MTQPKILLLAAGRGRRLAPLTDEVPKCLLDLGGATPLSLLATNVRGRVGGLVVVTGHGRGRLERALLASSLPCPVQTLFNSRFDDTNNIVSAWMAREHCASGFVLVNSDVICHPKIFTEVLSGPDETFLVVDPRLPARDEAMKVSYRAERLVRIGKDLAPEGCDGEYVGIARFDAEGAQAFFAAIGRILGGGGDQEWYEAAIGSAARNVRIGMRSTKGLPWTEIDDLDDLRRAREEVFPRVCPSGTTV